mmetsp:Transcript_6355/g.13437  ORF Transcript_6355/g.13437 Transcript_6355/m.13437 type:complete len:159 (-) Transcript_6355:288-764(-)
MASSLGEAQSPLDASVEERGQGVGERHQSRGVHARGLDQGSVPLDGESMSAQVHDVLGTRRAALSEFDTVEGRGEGRAFGGQGQVRVEYGDVRVALGYVERLEFRVGGADLSGVAYEVRGFVVSRGGGGEDCVQVRWRGVYEEVSVCGRECQEDGGGA